MVNKIKIEKVCDGVKVNEMNGAMLAFVGDAYYDLKIREMLIKSGINKANRFHKCAVFYVSAKAQASVLYEWIDKGILTESELEIVRRGRNAKTGAVPKNTDVIIYRHSTAFEALIGYLYLKEEFERLDELILEAIEIRKRDEDNE